MKEIRLTLKSTWFRLIKQGKKTEEYRDITPYYCSRLCANYRKDSYECRHCKNGFCRPEPKAGQIHFTLGYPSDQQTERHIVRKIVGIRKGYGKLLWRTSNNKVFIIEFKNDTQP